MQRSPALQGAVPRAESAAGRARFAALLAATVVVLTAPRLLLHELWRDEAWLWLAVTENGTFGELVTALGRSGQGYFFPLLCRAAAAVSESPRTLQVLQLVLTGAGAWVFARYAPLARRERALVLFGYFPFWEYAVISRHYVLGALLLWVACAAMRAGKPLVFGAALALLCQTTVYGWLLALAVAAGWILERPRVGARKAGPWGALGLVLAVAGAVAGIVQLVPTEGTSFAPDWMFRWNAARAAAVLALPWRAFVPLPPPVLSFWNSNLLDPWRAVEVALGLGVLALAVAILARRRAAVATFVVGTAGLLGFGYVKFPGQVRHQGHLWLLFLAALWFAASSAESTGAADEPGRRDTTAHPVGRWRGWAFTALLLAHVGAASWASWTDLRHPFTNGPATAAFIRESGLTEAVLLGHREPMVSSVALPLGKPFWSPSRRLFATHPDWGPTQREMADPELRCTARDLARSAGRDVVLVINRELPPWAEIELLGARVGAIVASEDYHVYRLVAARLTASSDDAACPVTETGNGQAPT